MLTAEHASGVSGSIQLWGVGNVGSSVTLLGDSSISGSTAAWLLGAVAVAGILAYAARSEGRKDHETRALARKHMGLKGAGRRIKRFLGLSGPHRRRRRRR